MKRVAWCSECREKQFFAAPLKRFSRCPRFQPRSCETVSRGSPKQRMGLIEPGWTESVRPKVVTYVAGTFCNPCVWTGPGISVAPGGIPTPDPQLRTLTLYP